MTEKEILELIQRDPWIMELLRAVRSVGFSDWMVGGGIIRGKVWDHLHEFSERTILPDVDVTYFNKEDITPVKDKEYEHILAKILPGVPWLVGNAAHLHIERDNPPYTSAAQLLEYWVETATAVGVHLDDEDRLTFFAPFGIDDLVHLVVRPTEFFSGKRLPLYKARQARKEWSKKWPKLTFIDYP